MIFIFFCGGVIYNWAEAMWSSIQHQMRDKPYWSLQGYTSFWMFFLGGTMAVFTHYLVDMELPLFHKMAMFSILTTALELISGYILNIFLKFQVWDYKNLPLNYKGQICIPYSLLWALCTIPFMWIDVNIYRPVLYTFQ